MANTEQVKAVVLEMDKAFPVSKIVELSERIDKEQKKVGEITVLYPVLENFGIEAEHDTEAESKRIPSDTMPIYKDERFDWLQSAIVARVEAQARSKTIKGKVKDGQTIAETFADLVAVGERGGEWLKIKSESRKSFVAYLEKAGKSTAVQTALGSLFANPESLIVCEQKFVDAISLHIAKWIEGLTDAEKARFEKPVIQIQESIDNRNKGLDLS